MTVTVLASASPARLAVLRAAGIDPVVLVSGVDEDAVLAAQPGADPPAAVAALAEAKAHAVVSLTISDHPDSVVIGCDSMLLRDGVLRGKPGSTEVARQEWAAMAGGSASLLTGHAIVRILDGRVVGRATGTQTTVIHFGRPSAVEVEAYLATGEPLRVAGSLTIDGYGGWFVDGVAGDHSSVIGISLPLTRRLLAEVGVGVVDLWRRR